MSTLLLVEDEHDFAVATACVLRAAGYEVLTVCTGREAIDVAARVRPKLILLDWMLRDGIDGIRVVEALAAMECMPRTIMMSAFVSVDLQADARRLGIADVLEKPVDCDRLVAAVRAVESAALPGRENPGPVPVLEVGPAGEILHVNRRAAQLFVRTGFAFEPASLGELFSPQALPDLQAAESRWVAASPSARSYVNWHIRAQSPGVTGTRLVIILEANEPHYLNQALIHDILGCKQAGAPPLDGRVVIVDICEPSRRLTQRMLVSAGIESFIAGTYAHALHLVNEDSTIKVVVIDLDAAAEGLSEFITVARHHCHNMCVIGAASPPFTAHPAGLDIDVLLPKPWSVSNLLEAIDTKHI